MIADRFVDVSYNAPTADSRPTATVGAPRVLTRGSSLWQGHKCSSRTGYPRQTYFLSVSILLLVFHPSCADRFMCAELSFPVLTRQRLETGYLWLFSWTEWSVFLFDHRDGYPEICASDSVADQRPRSLIRTVPILLNSPCTGSRVVSR